MDVERYLQTDNRVILVTGATEQHAYLSLATDVLIPARIALAVAEREHVLVAPPLNFGMSADFADFPGTISLSRQTFDLLLSEVVDNLLFHGFRRFLVINGHSGNTMPARLRDLEVEGLLRVAWFDWWRGEAARSVEAHTGQRIDHANWGENFPFTRVADTPREAKPPVNLDLAGAGESMRTLLGDGSFGGAYQTDDALMDILFEQVVEEAARLLRAL